ncbi:hypothetical protein AX16_009052 [Volvariella volvacea WC 439]|nr:hypothetical protein AX16_009052 [Volvariella volvacea WC 439]
MSAPPVPPRPYDLLPQDASAPPPVPPVPPDLKYQADRFESPPHFEDPLAAPRPHKIDPSLPANMAANLDHQLQQQQQYRPPPAPSPYVNASPGFVLPGQGPAPQPRPTSVLPPPQGANWSPWAIPGAGPPNPGYASPPQAPPMAGYSNQTRPYDPVNGLANSFNSLSFASAPPPAQQPLHRAPSVTYGPVPRAPSPPSVLPSLTAPLPTLQQLNVALPTVQQPTHDPALRVAWCRDVLFLVDRATGAANANDPPVGPVTIPDPQLQQLVQVAVPIILQLANITATPTPPYVAEATFFRATFAASGAYPEHIQRNPRIAFRDFEAAARAGYAAAWFRLGRDYENFNDFPHAKDCFERGVKLGVESCAYRMGMAHLMGQLGFPANTELAVPLLHRAATLASTNTPQPAYVYALLLLNEFSHVNIPPHLFSPFIPANSSATLEARKHLERAAYLGFAPAQYKLGHAYEFAQPPFPFDPLLSVQYYSLASQQGEVEADMALSKWFLCGSGDAGAPGGFEKDENLAWTFADKAARRGLPSAEFAMGYYAEVGVGGPKDLNTAIKWYTKAKEHGNQDAAERLAALNSDEGHALSRQEHDAITETKLVRKRTQARQRSDTLPPGQQQPPGAYPSGPGPQQPGQPPRGSLDGRQVVDMVRRNSVKQQGYGYNSGGAAAGGRLPPVQEQPGPSPGPSPGMPEPEPHRHSTSPGPGPRPSAGSPQPQHFPGANRYQLSDTPVPSGSGGASSPGPGRGAGPRPGRGRGNYIDGGYSRPPPSSGSNPGSPPPEPQSPTAGPKKPGPATFAEMGIHGVKAEDKDCVIM